LPSALLVGQLAGCATAYDSEKSFWNGQTGFHRPSSPAAGNWSLWATIWWTGKRRANTCSSGPVRWHWQGIPLDSGRDADPVAGCRQGHPDPPQFGFDEYEPDTFMDDMQVEHRTSALLVFTLEASPRDAQSMEAVYLAKIKINSD
jgi:hypothetical protein